MILYDHTTNINYRCDNIKKESCEGRILIEVLHCLEISNVFEFIALHSGYRQG